MPQPTGDKPHKIVGLHGTPGQGPFMAIVLATDGQNISEAKYTTYGCVSSEMCGQWLCEIIEKSPIDAARLLTETSIVKGIGAMPLGREHCPGLAIAALKHALDQC